MENYNRKKNILKTLERFINSFKVRSVAFLNVAFNPKG